MPVVSTVSRPVVVVFNDTYSRTLATVDYGGRMALKLEKLVDELIQTLRVVRPVATTLAQALDDGVVADVMTSIEQLQAATEVLTSTTGQLERITGLTGVVTNLPGVKAVRRAITPEAEAEPVLFDA